MQEKKDNEKILLSKSDKPALILIDIQKGFDEREYWGLERNNPDAEQIAADILYLWRKNSLPIFHVQHCSLSPNSPLNESKEGNQLKEIVKPMDGEPIIKKSVNSAFIGTDLKERLDELQIKKLLILGLTTDHCVSTTTRMAGNYGYESYIVSDACATFNKTGINGENYSAEIIHATALASLNNEFATVITSGFVKSLF